MQLREGWGSNNKVLSVGRFGSFIGQHNKHQLCKKVKKVNDASIFLKTYARIRKLKAQFIHKKTVVTRRVC